MWCEVRAAVTRDLRPDVRVGRCAPADGEPLLLRGALVVRVVGRAATAGGPRARRGLPRASPRRVASRRRGSAALRDDAAVVEIGGALSAPWGRMMGVLFGAVDQ